MNQNLGEEIGQIADKAENLISASKLPLTNQTHVENLVRGLEAIRDQLRSIYVEGMGVNPWEE